MALPLLYEIANLIILDPYRSRGLAWRPIGDSNAGPLVKVKHASAVSLYT